MPPFLSVIIPAYNEERRVGDCLEAIEAHVALHPEWETETIVVDDGSRDDTRGVVARWTERMPGLRLECNPRNMGKGASIRHGMLAAGGRWRLFTDADNSTPFEQVDLLLEVAERDGEEVVIGSRAVKGARLERRQPLFREVMGRTFNMIVRIAILPRIMDTQCGFKLFSARAAADVFGRVTRERFSFDVEALFLARQLGYRVVEVPVRWLNDERSTVHPVRDSWECFVDMFRVRRLHAGVKPVGVSSAHSTVAPPDRAPK